MAKVVWSTALLEAMKAPLTPANYQFLNQWLLREHAAGDLSGAQYGNNPFFTTAGAGGTVGPFKAGMFPRVSASVSPGANHAGVAMYPNLEIGVLANAFHISTEYPAIRDALRTGNPASQVNNSEFQSELTRWSGGGYAGFASIHAPAGPVGAAVDTGLLSQLGHSLAGGMLKSSWNPTKVQPGSVAAGVAGAAGDATRTVSAVGDFLGKLTDPSVLLRGLQVVAGAVLVLAGLLLLARQVGLAPDLPKVPGVPAAVPVE